MPLRLTIAAKPGKKISSITFRDGILIVAVRERGIDGGANHAIERAIALWLGVAGVAVSITHDASSRQKDVDIAGLDPGVIERRIAEFAERSIGREQPIVITERVVVRGACCSRADAADRPR